MATPGITPLHYCIFRGKRDEAISIIEKGQADLDAVDQNGTTPMHMACYRDDVDLVERLMKAGADASKVDKNGNTALHAAAGAGATHVAKHLATQGALIAVKNSEGLTALGVAEGHCPPRLRLAMIAIMQEAVANNPDDGNSTLNSDRNDDTTDTTISPEKAESKSTDRGAPIAVVGAHVGSGHVDPRTVGAVRQFPLRAQRQLDSVDEEGGEGEAEKGGVTSGTGGEGGDDAVAVDGRALLRLVSRQQETIDLQLRRTMDLLTQQHQQGPETATNSNLSTGQREEAQALIHRIKRTIEDMEKTGKDSKQRLLKDVEELVQRKERAAFHAGIVGTTVGLGLTVLGLFAASRWFRSSSS